MVSSVRIARPPGSSGTSAAPTPTELESEVRRLKKELEHERKVNQILKAATAFFSQDPLK